MGVKKEQAYLVLIRRTHTLHNLLRLRLHNATLLRNNLHQHRIHLTSHVRRIAADVKIRLLLQQLVDFLRLLLQAVLHVDFARSLAGEGGDERELVSEILLVVLVSIKSAK